MSAAALRQILSSSPVGIVVIGAEQRITDCNEAFASMVGRRPVDVVGAQGWTFFHPDSPPPDPQATQDLLAGKRASFTAERLLRAADGGALAVKLDWSVLRDTTGDAGSLVCWVTDVSAQAATVAARDAARVRAELLWERAPVGVIEGTPEGIITNVNDAMLTMLGRRREDLLGTAAADLADPAHAPSINRGVNRLLAGQTYEAERRYLHADGRSVPVHVSTALLRDEDNVVQRLIGFVVDMSQTEATRAELVRRQTFADTLLEAVDVGIVTCDESGGGVVRNRAQRVMLGLAHESDLADVPHFEIRGVDGAVLAPDDYPLARTLRGELVQDLDLRQGPVGGPLRDILVRGRQMRDADSEVIGAVIAVTDVTAARQATRELAQEREHLAEAKRIGRLGSFTFDVTTGVFSPSAQLRALWGLPAEGPVEDLAREAMHPEDAPGSAAAFAAALVAGGRHTWSFRLHHIDDGSLRHFSASVEVVLDEAGTPVKVTGTHQDVTDLVEAEQRAVRASQLFEGILNASLDYTFITRLATGAVVYGSPGKQILGLDADELTRLGPALMATLVHPEDQRQLQQAHVAASALADGEVLELRFRARHTDGTWRWLSRRATPFRRDDGTGEVSEVLGVIRDVTDVVLVEEQLTHAAMHDPLTGLPNRAMLMDRLEVALAQVPRSGHDIAVLFCDLDGFKAINDKAGHAAGDAVLTVAAERLRRVLREQDTLARVGGDEFVVVVEPRERAGGAVPDLPTSVEVHDLAIDLAERIRRTLKEPFLVDGVAHRVSVSIGIAYSGRPGPTRPVTPDQLLREADAAMYAAKRQGKDRFQVHRVDRPGA